MPLDSFLVTMKLSASANVSSSSAQLGEGEGQCGGELDKLDEGRQARH